VLSRSHTGQALCRGCTGIKCQTHDYVLAFKTECIAMNVNIFKKEQVDEFVVWCMKNSATVQTELVKSFQLVQADMSQNYVFNF